MAIITDQADCAVLRFYVCSARPRQDVLGPGPNLGQSAYKLCWGFRGDFSLNSCSFHPLQLLEHLPAQVCHLQTTQLCPLWGYLIYIAGAGLRIRYVTLHCWFGTGLHAAV